jgi:hypothetical protein
MCMLHASLEIMLQAVLHKFLFHRSHSCVTFNIPCNIARILLCVYVFARACSSLNLPLLLADLTPKHQEQLWIMA